MRPLWHGDEVPIRDFLDILCATHLTSYVDVPFKDRGGLMVVGPPGILKSTALELVDSNYPDALALSDVNAQSLAKLKGRIGSGDIRTLILPEYSKLYERNPATASNVEGVIRALVSEGFSGASFEDATLQRVRARATVVAAMTPEFREDQAERWQRSGFARRFMWSLLSLRQPDILERAVVANRLVDFGLTRVPPVPAPPVIPNYTTVRERSMLRLMVKNQPPPHAAQLQLLTKILAVLKWWHRNGSPRRGRSRAQNAAMTTVSLFARSLGKHGAELVV